MKTLIFSAFMGLSVSTVAQVDLDKPINLSGSNDSDRAITNLSPPVNGTDAANKDYVDAEIAANAGGSGHWVGELYGGGVIYAVYKDVNGDEHGLVVNLVDNSTGSTWSNITNAAVGASAQSPWNGAANTNAIVAQSGHTSSAAKICKDYTGGGNSDWFLPAINELNRLWTSLYEVHQTLTVTGGAALMSATSYWSSSEDGNSVARRQNFANGFVDPTDSDAKANSFRVRCVRAF